MQKQSNNHLLIAVLMLTIAIDVMGIGLVFPVIPELMMAKQSPFFVPTTADSIRNFYYGLSMALWPLGIFVGSAIIGKLSDFHGRKRMIIICLIGAIIAYLLSVLSFACGSLSLFIISRFICGFFGGSFGIAQAVILDVSPANKRIRNLSLITLAASVGFVLGPLVTTIVGMLSQTQSQAMSLPFWFGAFLAIINLISVYGLLPETYKQNMHRQKLKIISLIFSFRVMFVDRRVLILAISFLLLQIGWGYYAQTLPLVLAHIFNFTQTAIGFVFVIMSLGFAASTLCVQKIVLKRLSSAKAMFMTALLIGGIISVCSIWITPKSMVFSAFFGALLEIIFYTALLSVIAQKVNDYEQGAIMGGTTSVFGIAWAINAFTLGLLANWYILLPLYLGAVAIVLAGVISTLEHYKKPQASS